MGLFDLFRQNKKASAQQAKERLQILIAHERGDRNAPHYLPQMKQDIMEVIKKYIPVSDSEVKVQVENEDGYDILEVNITLPDN